MNFLIAADTDIGNGKPSNQDSMCVQIAKTEYGNSMLAVICDGMGGLSKGELASASTVREFARWFQEDFPMELSSWNWKRVAQQIELVLYQLNEKLFRYGRMNHVQMGTTATGILTISNQYMTFHIGDTRIYRIADSIQQLTKDQTFFERDLRPMIVANKITYEEAMQHPKRNALLQGLGACEEITPEIKFGTLEPDNVLLLCSDGFRHKLRTVDLTEKLSPAVIDSQERIRSNLHDLVMLVHNRKERDNISAIAVKTLA